MVGHTTQWRVVQHVDHGGGVDAVHLHGAVDGT